MASCDVCGAPASRAKNPVFPADEFRQFLAAGFTPPQAVLAGEAAEKTIPEEVVLAEWRSRAQQGPDEWLLCADCAERATAYRRQPGKMRPRWLLGAAAVILVTVLALGLRMHAVRVLPVDRDEDDYLAAAQRYAQFIAAGDVRGIVDYAYNYEHPPLAKLVYGLAIAPLPQTPLLPDVLSPGPPVGRLPQPHMRVVRTTSAVLGTLEVLALALLNPLAGLFLAIHTWAIKYTSEIMLESLPSLMSLLAVLCYVQAKRSSILARNPASNGWLLLSAVALGLTAASKYIYCVAGLAIVVDWVASPSVSLPLRGSKADLRSGGRRADLTLRLRGLLLWGLIVAAAFLVANPRMWSDPLHRLAQSVLFHGAYAQSTRVREINAPFWKPLVWSLESVPWPPGVFVVRLDTLIALLAAVGLTRLWRNHRVFALWLIIGLGFLMVWPTKWPQYMKTVSAPLCLAAAEGFRSFVGEPLIRRLGRNHARDATRLGSEE